MKIVRGDVEVEVVETPNEVEALQRQGVAAFSYAEIQNLKRDTKGRKLTEQELAAIVAVKRNLGGRIV